MDDVFEDFENATIFGIEVNTCDIDYEYFESLSIDLNEEEEDEDVEDVEEVGSSESSDGTLDRSKIQSKNNNNDNETHNNTIEKSSDALIDLKPKIFSLKNDEEINFVSTVEKNNNNNFIFETKPLDLASSGSNVEDTKSKKSTNGKLSFSECLASNRNKKLISTTSKNLNLNQILNSDFRKVSIQLNSSSHSSIQNAQHQVELYTNNVNNLCQYYLNEIRDKTANTVHSNSGVQITENVQLKKPQDELRRFECDICGKRFQKKCNLIAHKRTHTGERPFKCDICDKAFSESSSVFKHQRVHTGERPYKCEICDRVFKQICNLKKHRNKHNDSRVFRCNSCDKCFVRNNHLIQHQIVHSTQNNRTT